MAEVEEEVEEETEGDMSRIRPSLTLPLPSDAMDTRAYVRMNSFRAYLYCVCAPLQSETL